MVRPHSHFPPFQKKVWEMVYLPSLQTFHPLHFHSLRYDHTLENPIHLWFSEDGLATYPNEHSLVVDGSRENAQSQNPVLDSDFIPQSRYNHG